MTRKDFGLGLIRYVACSILRFDEGQVVKVLPSRAAEFRNKISAKIGREKGTTRGLYAFRDGKDQFVFVGPANYLYADR